jgi:hypothetical protein
MDEPPKLLKSLSSKNNLSNDEFIAMQHGETKII